MTPKNAEFLAAQVLATYDPLAAMAEADERQLAALVEEVQTQSDTVAEMLRRLTTEASAAVSEVRQRAAPKLIERWQVLVDCTGEGEQRTVYDRLTADGCHCRLLVT